MVTGGARGFARACGPVRAPGAAASVIPGAAATPSLGRARCETDGVTVLAVAHELAEDRRPVAQGPAQLADDFAAAAVVEVHVLAGQRRAPAVGAAAAVGLQGAQPAAKQVALELLNVLWGGRHDDLTSPRRAVLLPRGQRRRPVLPVRATGMDG
jgi:hypothetical protein